MKIRQGFVSNSSSSSFICDICQNIESGMDCTLEDVGMYECECGHCFCEDHAIVPKKQEVIDKIKKTLDILKEEMCVQEYEDALEEVEAMQEGDSDLIQYSGEDEIISRYGVLRSCCPICQRVSLSQDEGYKFLKDKYGLTDQDVLEMIKGEDKENE